VATSIHLSYLALSRFRFKLGEYLIFLLDVIIMLSNRTANDEASENAQYKPSWVHVFLAA
jgi:hypothetical protein